MTKHFDTIADLIAYSQSALIDLLAEAGLSAYAAAALVGVSPRQMQLACAGARDLGPAAWRLLCVTLSRSARRRLPPPVVP
jgi:hypothetical protein